MGSGTLNDFLTVLLHLNWLDYVFIAIIVYMTLSSASRGIITEAISFIGFVVAIFASGQLAVYVAPHLPKLSIAKGITQSTISFVVAFILIIVVFRVIAWIIRTAAHFMFLGWADWLGGAVLGLIQGIGIVTIILFLVAHYQIKSLEPSLQDSRIASLEGHVLVPPVLNLLPKQMGTLHNLL